MDRAEALVALNMFGDIGSVRLKRLLEFFDKPEDILNAAADRLVAVSGITPRDARNISSLNIKEVEKEFSLARRLGLEIILLGDEGYPLHLKDIVDPPIVLYLKGRLLPGDERSLAIVGSRIASFYGLSCAEGFARELAGKGLTIVSGMARGVDTYAHRGALKAGGRTIAVMGSGFNHIYPPENRELAEEISRNGAVISEFPIRTEPFRQNFPRRNRVISGLGLGVLVVEAAKNSGALITADFALEQGREVFALPGKVDSRNSFGTNELIRQGARLVSSCDDILEELLLPLKGSLGYKSGTEAVSLPLPVSREEKVWALLSESSLQLEELVEKTDMDISEISDILLRLQLKGSIRELAGKRFTRS